MTGRFRQFWASTARVEGLGSFRGAKRYLLVGLGRGGGGRKRFVDVRRRGGSEEPDGEGVMVEDR